MSSPDLLVWIDLEMSGLDAEQCRILEIATLVTNEDLEVVAEGPELVVHQPDEVLNAMDAWNTEHHGESGLTERVRASKISEQEAEAQTLAFLVDQVKAGASPLCGNSVHNDRIFLDRYMPRITEHVHYRNIDVSTVKELARRWYGDAAGFKKKGAHRALDDIRESIAELAFYRRSFFTKP